MRMLVKVVRKMMLVSQVQLLIEIMMATAMLTMTMMARVKVLRPHRGTRYNQVHIPDE